MSHVYDQVRKAIRKGEKTRAELARETGISESQLSYLMSGRRGLSVEALEKLADALGLEIVLRPRGKAKGR